MSTIGIIGAMDEEVSLLKEKMEIITIKEMLGTSFYIGRLFGKSVVVVRCGIGKVNAALCTQVLIDLFAVDCIINVGVAGAIFKELEIGDIVISSDAIQHDFDTTVFGDPIGFISRMNVSTFHADADLIKAAKKASEEILEVNKVYIGRVASGDQFISSAEAKKKIWDNVKAYCAEMEGAAIAHACYLNKIPFVIIRSISDKSDMKAEVSFETFVLTAAKNSSQLVEKIVNIL